MKIGIIVAMDKEFAQLQTLATDKNTESHAHYDFVTGRIGDNEVIICSVASERLTPLSEPTNSSAAIILTSLSPPVWLVEPTQALR